MSRPDNRNDNELRPVSFQTGVQRGPLGSVMITQGNTVVLCAATKPLSLLAGSNSTNGGPAGWR